MISKLMSLNRGIGTSVSEKLEKGGGGHMFLIKGGGQKNGGLKILRWGGGVVDTMEDTRTPLGSF